MQYLHFSQIRSPSFSIIFPLHFGHFETNCLLPFKQVCFGKNGAFNRPLSTLQAWQFILICDTRKSLRFIVSFFYLSIHSHVGLRPSVVCHVPCLQRRKERQATLFAIAHYSVASFHAVGKLFYVILFRLI